MRTTGSPDRIANADLIRILAPILERHGCSKAVAHLLAENCAAAERDGALSHGLFRMRGYVDSLRSPGWVDGHAVPSIEDAAPGFLRIDARNGFAVPALAAGRNLAIRKVRENGVAVVAIRNSHHLGALSLDVEPFAETGLVALSFINSMRAVVPQGGRRAVFGTNPMAFATPRQGAAPLVLDMATSSMANGDVQLAAREGQQLPADVGVDHEGKPTTDPKAVLDGGALLPFGGHKGAALSLMVEIMCAALVGGAFSGELDLSGHPGVATPRSGQTVLLIDPNAGRGTLPDFAGRVATLLFLVRDAGQDRLPGDRRLKARRDAERHGIPISMHMRETLSKLSAA